MDLIVGEIQISVCQRVEDVKQPESEAANVKDTSKMIAPDAAGKAFNRLGPQQKKHNRCYQYRKNCTP
jgi:hypothetical protein